MAILSAGLTSSRWTAVVGVSPEQTKIDDGKAAKSGKIVDYDRWLSIWLMLLKRLGAESLLAR